MKKITLCLFVLCNILVQAQWKQSLTGQTSLIRDISAVSNDIVWVKGENGNAISISLDGGKNWITKNLPAEMVNGSIGGFSAVSATTAYMIVSQNAQKGVYKTTDSGDNWLKQTTAFNADSPFPDIVYFWNENEGVAIGDGGATPDQSFEIYTTNNGGAQWNQISSANMPSGKYDWTYNSSSAFRVHGNSIYFQTGMGKIFKSVNKGLFWTVINTPIPSNQNFSFDFKDDLHGLISYKSNTSNYQLYSTSDGGLNWTSINATNCYRDLYNNPVNGIYFSTDFNFGLSYSKDNVNTWTIHPSFKNVGVGSIGISSTGKMFMGGLGYVYSTENYEGVNIWVKEAKITGLNTMDITYSENPDPASSQNMTNYAIGYLDNRILKSLNIQSLTQDVTNQSIVHVTMQSSLPLDTIIVNIGNVMDHNGTSGFPVLNKDIVLFNISKTIQVTAAGTLSTLLSANELATVTNLTLTGTIDARDFVTLRDFMPALKELDISAATIVAYTGAGGTAPDNAASASAPARIRRQVRQTISEAIESKDVDEIQYAKSADITYPANEIPADAFYSYAVGGKESLTSIALPLTLRSIGREAFLYTGLTSITIPETVTSIGDWAFQGTSVKNVLLPASLINLGLNCFLDIATLKSIDVAAINTAFSSEQGVLFNKDKSRLITYPTGKDQSSYTVPEGVKLIDYGAFYNNQYLTDVQLPSTLTDISDYAFNRCDNLNIVNFPSSLKSIGVAAFFSTNITDVNLSACNQLTTITEWAFQDCSVANLSLPASITTIEQYAFSGYNNLTQIDWSDNTALTTLGDCVLIACENLNSVKLPRSLSSVGSNMFTDCGKLTDIIVDAANPYFSSMDGVLFNKNYTSLIAYAPGKTAEKYLVPTTVTEISDAAFMACSNLKSVDAQNSHLVSIGLSAFDSTPLTEIILPASVTTIGKYGFYNCSALSTFKIYSAVPPALGDKVFKGASTATCQLYVPKDSKATYALADQWKDFTNIVELVTAIPSIQNEGIRLYPNPVTDNFRINGLEGTAILTLTDLNGKMLLVKTVTGNESVNTGTLSKGVYMVRIEIPTGLVVRKLLKQ